MSSRIVCDNCKKLGIDVNWINISNPDAHKGSPYFLVGVCKTEKDYEVDTFSGLDFCSPECLHTWFDDLLKNKLISFLDFSKEER